MFHHAVFIIAFFALFFSSEVDGQCTLADNGNLTTAQTIEFRSWEDLANFKIYVNETDGIIFGVRACAGVHFLLQTWPGVYRHSVYEIVIGGKNNTESSLFDCLGCKALKTVSHEPLHCNYFKYFWLTWCGNFVRLGEGYDMRKNMFIESRVSSKLEFRAAAIKSESLAQWAFCEYRCY